MQATIGAHVKVGYKDLVLYEKDFPSSSVYSRKKGIAVGCLVPNRLLAGLDNVTRAKYPVLRSAAPRFAPARAPGYSLVNDGTVVGTTWTGTIAPAPSAVGGVRRGESSCNAGTQQYGYVSLQITERVGGVITLTGATVWSSQSVMPSADLAAAVAAPRAGRPGDSCVLQSDFVLSLYPSGAFTIEPQAGESDYSYCANGDPALPYGWTGTAYRELLELDARSTDGCSTITLKRSVPNGPPQPPAPPTPPPGPPPPVDACEKYEDEGSRDKPGSCLAAVSCGWCASEQGFGGCCLASASGTPVLPCPNEYGDIPDCKDGWHRGE